MEEIIQIQKSIKFPKDLVEKILKDAVKEHRDFSKQVIFIISKYYEFKES